MRGEVIMLPCRAGHAFQHVRHARFPKWCPEHRPAWVGRPVTERNASARRDCALCGVEFTSIWPWQKFCSTPCQRTAQGRRRYERYGNSQRTFPRIQGKARLAIADRDGWRCGLCHAAIDPSLRWPHPGSLSIDHVDPHGSHEPDNWQASHLACNVQAGAKRAA